MTIPSQIRKLTLVGLEKMYQHPSHHFDWRIRRGIYQELKEELPQDYVKVRGELGILAAQHVLPLFTNTFPEDDLPPRLLHKARQIIREGADPQAQEVDNLLEEGYHSTGIDNLNWRDKTAINAEYAGNACYKALLEATGWQSLINIGQGDTTEEITDKDIAHLATASDTAGTAAIAFAIQESTFEIDVEKLKRFWQWWTQSALTEAWQSQFL